MRRSGPITSLLRYWDSLPAISRRHLVIAFVICMAIGVMLPTGGSTYGESVIATDAKGRSLYVSCTDEIFRYYGLPWSHTTSATWHSSGAVAVTPPSIALPLKFESDAPFTHRTPFLAAFGSADRMQEAAAAAAASRTGTASLYRINWLGAAARLLIPLTAVTVLVGFIAWLLKDASAAFVANGRCPRCIPSHPLLPTDAAGARLCPECGARYETEEA